MLHRTIQLRSGTPPQQFASPAVVVSPADAVQVTIGGSAAGGGVLVPGADGMDLSFAFVCLCKCTANVAVTIPVRGFADVELVFAKQCGGVCDGRCVVFVLYVHTVFVTCVLCRSTTISGRWDGSRHSGCCVERSDRHCVE